MEGMEFGQIFNAMLASIVFPVVVGVLNRLAERGTAKDTKARLELVGESLAVLEKLQKAAEARPGLADEAKRFEDVIRGQCDDLFADLDARHAEFRQAKSRAPFRFMPKPQGLWGFVWWFLALATACFTALLILGLAISPFDAEVDDAEYYATAIATVATFVVLTLLLRWAAFAAEVRAKAAEASGTKSI